MSGWVSRIDPGGTQIVGKSVILARRQRVGQPAIDMEMYLPNWLPMSLRNGPRHFVFVHRSGFVAIALLVLAIAVAVLVLADGRRNTTHPPPPVVQTR